MELYDENMYNIQAKANQKKSKVPVIIGVCIALLVVVTIVIIYGIIYLKKSITTIELDGKANNEIESVLHIEATEEGLQLYMPIIKMSQFFGYEGFVGDYINKSEDKSQCHTISENETVAFTKGSNTIVKIYKDAENEYITIDKPVFEKDGELYTTIDGIEKAFNVLFGYDEEFKNIEIFSMDYLISHYVQNLKIQKYSTSFADKKAIFENMIIIQDDNQYGVINIETQRPILETKYEQITYLPSTTDFLVKSNGKYGIVTKNAEVKIRTVYDEIKIIDNKNGLYLVKENNLYGIVNIDGKVIITPEYKEIGANIDKYSQNGLESKYILLNKIIPIKNDKDLWGLFDINGKQIAEFQYTGLGCSTSVATNAYPVLVIPKHKIIVVQKDKYYSLITLDGEQLIPDNVLNSVYLKLDISAVENQYYMTYNEKTINVEEWLKSTGR